ALVHCVARRNLASHESPACRSKTRRKIICDCRAVHLRGGFLNAKTFATTSNRVTYNSTRIARCYEASATPITKEAMRPSDSGCGIQNRNVLSRLKRNAVM